MTHPGRLYVYSGPSGVGKGTLLAPLLEEGLVRLSVSATTRPPRPNETDGVQYHFVSREEFEQMIRDGEMLEYASYNGNYYGTPRRFVEETLQKGKNVILEIEVQGAAQIRRLCPDAVAIFIAPPSLGDLRKRLIGRGTETLEVIEGRLSAAAGEISAGAQYDFIIINDDVTRAREELAAAIRAGGTLRRLNQNKIKEVLSLC
jgi:guanylate kinase